MPSQSSAARVRAHRAEMRARGYMLIQRWVPDTRTEALRGEIELAIRRNNAAPDEVETMTWLENAQSELDLGESPDVRD